MAIKAGIGLSQHVDNSYAAGQEAVQASIQELGQAPDIIFLFASIKYNQQEVVQGARNVAPSSLLVGGSAAGEITSFSTVFDAVAAMAIASDQISFAAGVGEGVSHDSFAAGAMAARKILEVSREKPSLFISLPDGMTGNGSAIVEGTQSVLGKDFSIIGGSLGDDYLFKQTWEYYQDQVLTDAAIGVGLSGTFSYGFGIKHGWQPVGLPMKVTKATGTLLQEVDGKPALTIYQEYFGKEAAELIREPLARMAYTYPLGLVVEGSDELLIRDPIVANEKGEITMAAAIPQGTTIRLMIGDRDKAMAAAKDAAHTAIQQLEGKTPRLVLMFNCMARNKLLGIHCSEENQLVQEIIGKDVPMLGFYTYGEQGPLLGKKGTPAYFHNETMTLVVIGD